MMTTTKEVKKEFALAKKHFNRAIELAKKNMIIGNVQFVGTAEKKTRVRKSRVKPEPEEKNLPDLDKDGYMKKGGE